MDRRVSHFRHAWATAGGWKQAGLILAFLTSGLVLTPENRIIAASDETVVIYGGRLLTVTHGEIANG
jgi:hypothetical protein